MPDALAPRRVGDYHNGYIRLPRHHLQIRDQMLPILYPGRHQVEVIKEYDLGGFDSTSACRRMSSPMKVVESTILMG